MLQKQPCLQLVGGLRYFFPGKSSVTRREFTEFYLCPLNYCTAGSTGSSSSQQR